MKLGQYEIVERIYRKLLFYQENKKAIHIKLVGGGWRNGNILDLSQKKFTLVLDEFKMGAIPILLEDILEDSIDEYRLKPEGNP